MALPAMKSWTIENTKAREVQIVIEHDHGQSFSRAVKPRALKEFKKWTYEHIVFGDPMLMSAGTILGGQYIRDSKERCLSVFRFTY